MTSQYQSVAQLHGVTHCPGDRLFKFVFSCLRVPNKTVIDYQEREGYGRMSFVSWAVISFAACSASGRGLPGFMPGR